MSRGSLFLGLMFLGTGVGLMYNQAGAGALIGMGLGFIVLALLPKRYKRGSAVYIEEKPLSSRIITMIIGVLFIIGGLHLAGLFTIPEFVIRNAGALFLIVIGALFIAKALVETVKIK